MRAPKEAIALNKLQIDTNDYRLIDASGQPFGSILTSSSRSSAVSSGQTGC